MKRKFDTDTRLWAVARVLAGERVVQVAQQLGASPDLVYFWMRRHRQGMRCVLIDRSVLQALLGRTGNGLRDV